MNESESIEFKKSLAELGEGLNSMAAILNKHAAGELWFRIKNDGTPVGMEVTETTLRKVSQSIAAHIEPKIFPEVSNVLLSGKSCIRVSFSGSEKPYYSHGRAYMRVADEDRQLSAKEIESIILRKNRSHRGWDSEPIPDASFKPDAAKVRAYVRKAGLPWTNTPTALKSLGLHVDGHHLNAARVFFAKPPAHALRCAVFATSTTATIIDQHDFNGDILTLINAFCHRDYRDPDEVRIAIFPDRVEVRNPGRLMEGVTLRTLKTAKVFRRRNPLIADLLRRIHLIEAWGRGIPLIIEKAPQARFSEIAGVFITEFPRPQAAGDSVTKSQPRSDAAGQVTAPVTAPVSDYVGKLLYLLGQREPLGNEDIRSAFELKSRRRLRETYLGPALSEGLIQYTIPDKPNSSLQKYRLTEKGRGFAATLNPP
jgi:ATP-dependent DNA helicase RecG